MTFGQDGWGCDAPAAHGILDAFLEEGGNFIDTADKYAATRTESIIGEWLRGRNRGEVVLATKCFFPTGASPDDRGLSRKHILAACESSLSRLNTEYIDLYQAHAPDPKTPIEETLDAFATLVQQGKVLHTGMSNFPAWEAMRAHSAAERLGKPTFISGQYLYNLLKRDIEAEILPACRDCGIGVLCWSPLSGGMLTGKYLDAAQPPPDTRLGNRSDLSDGRYKQWVEKSSSVVSELIRIAQEHDVTPATVALAWLLANDGVASVIVGASSSEQARANCVAGTWDLPAADLAKLNELSEPVSGYPENWIRTTMLEVFGEPTN